MVSTIPQNRPQANSINNILSPSSMTSSATFGQDISRAIEASASMLPKYYTYNAGKLSQSTTTTSSSSSSASSPPASMLENISIADLDHSHQPPPPPPSPVGFSSTSTYADWSSLNRERV